MLCYASIINNIQWVELVFRRLVIVREADKVGEEPIDVTPKDFSVRSTVQEYGGGAFNVCGEDFLVFSNFHDQRLYRQSLCSQGLFHFTFSCFVNYGCIPFLLYLLF